MRIFSDKAENLGRQSEVDLLRGFAAILLVIVHVGLYLGNHISTGLWTFCDIIGSEPAAPVFMALMGVSMVYSRHRDPKSLLKRGIRLLAAGYLLNAFRSLLPLLILGNADEWASVEAFFVVDILQFAGLSFLFTALLKKLKCPSLGIFAVSVVMVIADQYIMLPDSVPWSGKLLTGLVDLFCPVSEWSCFPFLTWFVFPAFGLVFGEMLTRCADKNRLYAALLPIGLCGALYVYGQFYRLYPNYTSYYWGNNFYYMGLKNALLTLTIIVFALSFWFFAEKILPEAVKKRLVFLSRHLNTYYIMTWITISMLIHAQAVFGWQFGSWATVGIMALLTELCVWLTKLWLSLKKTSA